TALSQCFYRCAHGRASGQSVIDQDGDLVTQLGRGTSFTIDMFTPLKLGCFLDSHSFNCLGCVRYSANNVFVQNTHPTRANPSSSQFFESGHTKFTNDEDVKWCTQALRYFVRNRDTSSRQSKYNRVIAVCVFFELLRKQPPRFGSVCKGSFRD